MAPVRAEVPWAQRETLGVLEETLPFEPGRSRCLKTDTITEDLTFVVFGLRVSEFVT